MRQWHVSYFDLKWAAQVKVTPPKDPQLLHFPYSEIGTGNITSYEISNTQMALKALSSQCTILACLISREFPRPNYEHSTNAIARCDLIPTKIRYLERSFGLSLLTAEAL